MDKSAIVAARSCLERAKEALSSMQNADSFEKMEVAWSDFLTMSNRVYTKLEQGAKTVGKSNAWFGRKKHERRQAPLLKYIKNARDADEHGLDRITERTPGGIGINFPGRDRVAIKHARIGGGKIELETEDPTTPIAVTIIPASVKLVEVTNHGDRYQPPTTHKEQAIPRIHPTAHPNPIVVAQLAISHLTELIAEAEALEL